MSKVEDFIAKMEEYEKAALRAREAVLRLRAPDPLVYATRPNCGAVGEIHSSGNLVIHPVPSSGGPQSRALSKIEAIEFAKWIFDVYGVD